MATENIVVYFSNAGVPAEGLSPVIDGIVVGTAVKVLVSQAMSELSDGFYRYTWTSYNPDIEYVFQVDGGSELDNNDRYIVAGNGVATLTNQNRIMTISDIDDFDRTTDSLEAIRTNQLSSDNWEGVAS